MVSRDSKVDNFANSLFFFFFFFFCWLLLCLVFWPRLGDSSVCQSPKGVCVCHSLGQVLGCAYTICRVWSNLNFLHISQWITLPTQSCLVLYSFCANLLHSIIIIIISLVPALWHVWHCQFNVETLLANSCKIHRLHLCRGIKPPPPRMSWIWY